MGGHPRHGCRQRFRHLLNGGIIHAVKNLFMVSGGRCVLVCGYEEIDSSASSSSLDQGLQERRLHLEPRQAFVRIDTTKRHMGHIVFPMVTV